jgi:hypothetical protein
VAALKASFAIIKPIFAISIMWIQTMNIPMRSDGMVIRMSVTSSKYYYLLAGILCLSAVTVEATPKFPAPPKANVTALGEDMVVNGIPMQARKFYTHYNVEEVVEFYKNLWSDNVGRPPGYDITKDLPPWTIITRIEDDYLLTVQVTRENKHLSMGYLAMSPLVPEDNAYKTPEFPKMRGSVIMNDISSKDRDTTGRTVVIQNRYSAQSNVSFYRNHYKNAGWGSEMDKNLGLHSGHILQFSKRDNHVTLVILSNKGLTYITSQSVREDLF